MWGTQAELRSNDSPVTVPTDKDGPLRCKMEGISIGALWSQALQIEGANPDFLLPVFRGRGSGICSLHGHRDTAATVLWLLPITQAHRSSLCSLWSRGFTSPHTAPRRQTWAWEGVDSHGDKCSQAGWSWV